MKFIAGFFIFFIFSSNENMDSKNVLKKMHDRYSNKWYHTFTFSQTTERYRNDSLIKTSTWYEAVMFPDKFRIDFGDIKNGNAVIFSRDSAYNFRSGKLDTVTINNDDLTFLLGGMYFTSFDSVLSKISHLGYNLNKFKEASWHNAPVYIIGADSVNEKVNQLWIDKEKLVLVRFIEYNDNHKEEGILENQQQFGRGWSETKATFYFDDKLAQKEYYHDCKANENIDPRVFDPLQFGKVHWYKEK
jgi:hypothetical protein